MGVPGIDELASRVPPQRFGRRPLPAPSHSDPPAPAADPSIPHKNVGHVARYGDEGLVAAATRQGYFAALDKSKGAFRRRRTTTDTGSGFIHLAAQYCLHPRKREAQFADGAQAGWYSNPTTFLCRPEEQRAPCPCGQQPPSRAASARSRRRKHRWERSRSRTPSQTGSSRTPRSGAGGGGAPLSTWCPTAFTAHSARSLRSSTPAFSDALLGSPCPRRRPAGSLHGDPGGELVVQGRLTRGEAAVLRHQMLRSWLAEQNSPLARGPSSARPSRPPSAGSSRPPRPASASSSRPGTAVPRRAATPRPQQQQQRQRGEALRSQQEIAAFERHLAAVRRRQQHDPSRPKGVSCDPGAALRD
eukprot:TRINITY_DN14688_c0_g1_i2.p1 TRINITY_DN14688_c0_g1~~TRINITY_DN14688_c0_g1_i2.p1  ORF type:complete len:394 (+),score=113.39 TRINITY_DN14688_c0_g1_i2:108-1184(+)